MATRSTIWTIGKDEDGKNVFNGIYCHWDGYLEYNGEMLFKHYNDIKKVDELIALGDISSLAENIKPDPSKPHDFDNKQENVVVAYHRDRGEEKNNLKAYSIDKIEQQEFNYLFKDNEWFLVEDRELKKLSDLLNLNENEHER